VAHGTQLFSKVYRCVHQWYHAFAIVSYRKCYGRTRRHLGTFGYELLVLAEKLPVMMIAMIMSSCTQSYQSRVG
jgi:hypothetical protein